MALSRVKQERLERLKKRLNLYYEAEEAVLLNQEYVIGTKSLKRADFTRPVQIANDPFLSKFRV